MVHHQLIVLACAAALAVGCATKKNHTASAGGQTSTACQMSAGATAAAPTTRPSVQTANLAGAWQLAMPRCDARSAKITATDDTHVTIEAGENLSGKYVVQGSYLLILTRDEKLRPLAWRINSPDSLTVVRAPELGEGAADYTGVTLVRGAGEATEPDDAEASVDTAETTR